MSETDSPIEMPKRGRGRPKKIITETPKMLPTEPKKRGRPKKINTEPIIHTVSNPDLSGKGIKQIVRKPVEPKTPRKQKSPAEPKKPLVVVEAPKKRGRPKKSV